MLLKYEFYLHVFYVIVFFIDFFYKQDARKRKLKRMPFAIFLAALWITLSRFFPELTICVCELTCTGLSVMCTLLVSGETQAINECASDLQEVRTPKNSSILELWAAETLSEKSAAWKE